MPVLREWSTTLLARASTLYRMGLYTFGEQHWSSALDHLVHLLVRPPISAHGTAQQTPRSLAPFRQYQTAQHEV
eukprot:3418515-Rhodomonas_salina.4